MQVIALAGKSKRNGEQLPAKAADCAAAVLEAVPSIMWFVRRHLRCKRVKGLSVPQFRVLALAEQCSRASLSDVSNHLGVSLPTASRIVTGLVAKEFLTRTESEGDRRCRPIRLTARGQAAMRQAWSGAHEAMAAALTGLTPAECEKITAAMRQLAQLVAAASDS